jgi:23S rRNA (guanine745-N1)-methyltransferase
MIAPPLACTVRGCGLRLERCDRTYVCPTGHSFDIARRGYVNLLQPQDRKSPDSGDSPAIVGARAVLDAADVGRALVDEVAGRVRRLGLARGAVVVDLGAGTGQALGAIGGAGAIPGIGLDLSVAAAGHAAGRFPHLHWVVANADRRLPLVDGSVDVILSLHARRNPVECARVLTPGGRLLVAVPAHDDLIQLRTLVQGEGVERDRSEPVLAEHASRFRLTDRGTVRQTRHFERDLLLALLRSTYRGGRASSEGRVEALTSHDVTLASNLLLFERASP